ncbi:hypothetical protein ABK040_002601 [Willaertia magna]
MDKEKKEVLTLQYFTLLERYTDVMKNELIPSMKEGFFNMASCKLNMGKEYLGVEHIPSNPSSKIKLDLDTFELVDYEDLTKHFSVKGDTKTTEKEEIKEDNKSLRKRKTKEEDKKEEIKEEDKKEKLKGSKLDANVELDLKQKNPIYWFGTIQLSEDLVESQRNFVKALHSTIELGKIIKELNELEKELRK